jgi:hypothetical protein
MPCRRAFIPRGRQASKGSWQLEDKGDEEVKWVEGIHRNCYLHPVLQVIIISSSSSLPCITTGRGTGLQSYLRKLVLPGGQGRRG